MNDREIVVLPWPDRTLSYPHEVHHRLRAEVADDHARTASELGLCVDVVSIQHHPSIWGGEESRKVIEFVAALTRPAVVTLHAVTATPSVAHHAIIRELTERAAATVVMSRHAATLLDKVYGADPERISMIHHGVPDVPLLDAETIKPGLAVAGRKIILSFGLLTPRKGIELMLRAMPAVIKAHPTAMYVVVGATHPDALATDGEAYRQSLLALVSSLGLGDHVQFVDRFAGRVELIRWLEAADVVVTPYTDLDQSVAGTLAAAIGTGRAVVSTPYAYAVELLEGGRGVVVPALDPDLLSTAVTDLLSDDVRRATIGRIAHEASRAMTWTRVGAEYAALFERSAQGVPARMLPTKPDRRRSGVSVRP
jgi:glycosyltransferase involved in cell wall biosynthesis